MRKALGVVALVAAVALAAPGAHAATVVFFDNFESYKPVTSGNDSSLNWIPPATSPWVVQNGTIDLVETGNYGLTAAANGGRFFLDLDGSMSNAGELLSIDLSNLGSVSGVTPGPFINLVAGNSYELRFLMAGNQRTNTPDSITFGVVVGTNVGAPVASQNFVLARTSPWQEYVFNFVYQPNARIFFTNAGGDNQGVLLDNVKISLVPVPAAAGLGLMGMGLLPLIRRRKATSSK